MESSDISRRRFLAGATSAVLASKWVGAQAAKPAPSYWYVDGYHGGIDGHMPARSLANVLDGLDRFPEWKVSFEIEPYSWAAFAKSDPASIEKMRKHLSVDPLEARIEFVSGAYGQTYAWNINGESNIRQLIYGIAEIHAVFPDVKVDTYAVQEPCWTSCLPQILKSLGYKRAVLDNSTDWGGYHGPTLNADLMHWQGPDGTSISAVPRYACDALIGPATERNAQPSAEYVAQCNAAGIAHPAGTILQDMGWPGKPWRLGMSETMFHAIQHATWRQYAEKFAQPPTQTWRASQEDYRVGLVWGASVLQRIAQIVRRGENLLIQAEKLASLANIHAGLAYPSESLLQSWKYLLRSQHHDVWIVPYNRRPGGSWASEADERFTKIEKTCADIVADATKSLCEPDADAITVVNTSGVGGLRLVVLPPKTEFPAAAKPSHMQTQTIRVGDEDCVAFLAAVPPMGMATYDNDVALKEFATGHATGNQTPDGKVFLRSDRYELQIDPAHGGAITRLFAFDINRDFVDPQSSRKFGELRGFFGSENAWLSSADKPAKVTLTETGPLRATAKIDGFIGSYPFTTTISLTTGSNRIDFKTNIDFPLDSEPFRGPRGQAKLRIGEPWQRGRDATRSNQRPCYDSSYKLQALFPTSLKNPTLDKNAAFDVCRSTQKSTKFDSWEALRHNVIVNWVDLLDADGSAGLAVFSDHTTAYHHGEDEPLGLVLAYAGVGNWFDYAMGRKPEVSYAIVPHTGDWAAARLWRELAMWSEPLVVCAGRAKVTEPLIEIVDSGIELVTLYQQGGSTLARFFNADGDAQPVPIMLSPRIKGVDLVELDGRLTESLKLESNSVQLSMPRFGVRTLRLTI
jgi:alpha-mannosidase